MSKKTIKNKKTAINFCVKEGISKDEAESLIDWCYWKYGTKELSVEKLKKEIEPILNSERWKNGPLWKKVVFNENMKIRGTGFFIVLKEIYKELIKIVPWAKHTFSKENIKKHRKEIIAYFLMVFIIFPLALSLGAGFFYLLWMSVVYIWHYFIDIYYPEPLPLSFEEVLAIHSICLFVVWGYLFYKKIKPKLSYNEYSTSSLTDFIVSYSIVWICFFLVIIFFNAEKNDYEKHLKEKAQIIYSTD